MNPLKTVKKHIGNLDAEVAAKVITAASDFTLIVDGEGVIRDLALASREVEGEDFSGWIGKPWIDTVTIESRPKITEMLKDASAKEVPRWRHVNHTMGRGADLPVRYSTIETSRRGNILAMGRDLRPMAALQQRLVDAQQSTEREYARLRNAETRYRALFQLGAEAILIADAASLKVIEANPAAMRLMGKTHKKIVGRSLLDVFDGSSATTLQAQIGTARAMGQASDEPVLLADGADCTASLSLFRQDNASHLLVRLTPKPGEAHGTATSSAPTNIMAVVQSLPDGFVVTGPEQTVLSANTAFLELTQLPTEDRAKGQSLERWIGRSSAEYNLLISSLKEHGSVRHFATVLRGEFGLREDVEISGVSVVTGDLPCLGFTIRSAGRLAASAPRTGDVQLPRSVNQLMGLVGSVPLKELVRETTDLIERLCIEAALELAGDNRVSAAELLGVSRQSLYVKLRRYGLGDLGSDNGQLS